MIYFNKNKFYKNGFTLIELLVVIAIIAILSAVVMRYTYDGTVRGRDARRKQNVDQIVKAVNLFYSQNGTLPRNSINCASISDATYGPQFKTDIAPFMPTIQYDPTRFGQTGDYLLYNVTPSTGSFKVCAIMEQSVSDNGNGADYSSCPSGAVYNYCVNQ